MEALLSNQAMLWFILGFSLLAIELIAFGLTSGVLLFGSLGALATGVMLYFEIIPNNFVAAVASFAVSTTIVTAVLWVPLKKLQSGAELGNDRSSDLIGYTFSLQDEIRNGTPGKHRYSGIDWQVEVSEESPVNLIEAGTRVTVVSVSVGVFQVKPA